MLYYNFLKCNTIISNYLRQVLIFKFFQYVKVFFKFYLQFSQQTLRLILSISIIFYHSVSFFKDESFRFRKTDKMELWLKLINVGGIGPFVILTNEKMCSIAKKLRAFVKIRVCVSAARCRKFMENIFRAASGSAESDDRKCRRFFSRVRHPR